MRAFHKHSVWIRWTHWIHFPLLALMFWSGLWIYWANDVYRPFFPDSFYGFFGLDHRLALGMAIHFFVMWFFIFNGLAYALYLAFSGEWRELVPRRETFREAWAVVRHDLGLSREAPPQGKFNAAQRLAYSAITVIGALAALSGLAIYKPVRLGWLTAAFGGYETARLVHFICMLSFAGFFMVHILQVMRAGWNNFRSMVSGYEIRNPRQ